MSKKINRLFNDADNGICSNDPANKKVNWSQAGMLMLDNFKPLNLYNVQFQLSSKLVNRFIYAQDRDDAIELVTKRYKNFEVDKDDVYCQRVDLVRGMIFSR